METTKYALRPLLAEVRHGYQGMRDIRTSLKASKREVMRTARAERKALKRDLAGYTTPGDLNDLEAILDRYSDQETADIRRMIAGRR
jgi:aerobic-type carbon monoxide dehydrogenase small subunit (CoxS/CutS family)